MAEWKKRGIDAGSPFVVWAPVAHAGGPSHCGHGVWIDARLGGREEAPLDEISLLLRAAEQSGKGKVEVWDEPVTVTLTLSSGTWSPRDERAHRFADEHAWLGDALAEHLELLRRRARRVAAQRDRETSCAAGLANAKPGVMAPYEDLFPADWDFLVQYGGHMYWAIDLHCLNPACACSAIMIQFHNVDSPTTRLVGQARLERGALAAEDPACSTPLATRLFNKLWAESCDELERRRAEVRAAVLRRAGVRASATAVRAPPATVSRNAPCPCGSGKKHKRCCAGADAGA